MEPRIQYATTRDGVSIAYSDVGAGYPLVLMQGPPFSHVQREMQLESYRAYNETHARGRRVIRFDSRGSGLSQRDIPEFTIDGLGDDLIAVVDRLELDRFAVCAIQAGGLVAVNVATRLPERVSHLVFLDAYANAAQYQQIPQVRAFLAVAESDWDLFTESVAHSFFGWDAGPPARDYAKFLRECIDQKEAVRFFRDLGGLDLTNLLPGLKMPSLVLHHSRSVLPDMAAARELAAGLPNAELVLLQGFWNDHQDDLEILDRAVSKLLGQEPAAAVRPHTAGNLVTILFTDVQGSTALTQRLGDVKAREVFREHERITRASLAKHGGSEVKTMGDGFMASFGSASRALDCATEMQREFAAHNAAGDTPLNVRIGVNAGEPIAEQEDLFGTAVITASRIAGAAQGGEILVANVVRELVAGRGFLFADRGEMVLRGFDDPVRVFEMKWRADR